MREECTSRAQPSAAERQGSRSHTPPRHPRRPRHRRPHTTHATRAACPVPSTGCLDFLIFSKGSGGQPFEDSQLKKLFPDPEKHFFQKGPESINSRIAKIVFHRGNGRGAKTIFFQKAWIPKSKIYIASVSKILPPVSKNWSPKFGFQNFATL